MDFRKDWRISDLPLLRDADQRHFLAQSLGYCCLLFLLTPVLICMAFPLVHPCDTDPSERWWTRLILVVATGGISALAAFLPAFALVRWRNIRALYLSLLLPLAISLETAQIIFFREFGTHIDERILGLFQGNFSALWTFARNEYHIEWAILAAIIGSALMAVAIHRRKNWFPRFENHHAIATALLVLFSGTVAVALRLDVGRANHFSSAKISEAPLFRIALFAGSTLNDRATPDFVSLLDRFAPVEEPSPLAEIEKRLGSGLPEYLLQKARKPSWLKQQPKHVFCFLLESFETDFVTLPEMESLAPNFRRYHREGLSITNMASASGATIDAIHSAMAGVAAQPRYPGPKALARFELDTLPKMMERAGYRTVFYAGSHRKFGGKGDACEAYGYSRFLGCPDVATGIPANEWGVDDSLFYEWTRGLLTESLASSPHFITFLNVSNHAPYSAPVDTLWSDEEIPAAAVSRFIGADRAERCRYAKHVKYADQELGTMVAWLKEQYPGSLFVFFGDHHGAKFKSTETGQVPFILWNDEVLDPSVDTSAWFGAQMDVPATLATLLLPQGSEFRNLGRPVWDLDPTRVSVGANLALARPSANGSSSPEEAPPLSLKLNGEGRQPVDPTLTQIRRKASAILALSWGYLNHQSFGNDLPPRTPSSIVDATD